MKLYLRNLLFVILLSTQANGQTPGVSTFYEQFSGDTREYIEYIPGNLPIIISAPHGGVKQSGQTIGSTFYPDNDSTLPDRSCGTNERDDNTDILIREIQAEIFALTGCYAHVIISNLHRSKLDPNRESSEATCGDSDALDHWNAWHSFIDQASTSVNNNWGKGLYIDLHGQSHTIPRIEIGYNITANELNSGNLNSTTNINRSTIKSLVSNNLNSLTHEQLIRGTNSLGELFQDAPAVFYNANVNPGCGVTSGYRAVPSASDYGNTSCDDTRPHSNAYFDGNFYNNRRHGSGNGSGTNAGSNDGGGTIDGIMTEVNRRVRDLGTYNGNVYDNNPQTLVPFAKEYAAIVLDYIDIHYNDFALFSYPSNTYDINDPNPSPSITGLSDGTFSSTVSLSIDASTGVVNLSSSTAGNYVVTYTVGTCGYYKETFNFEITGTLPDTEAPTAPTNLTANNETLTTVDLSWDASSDNVGVTEYEIYQDGNLLTKVSTTTFQVTGLSNGTTYAFYVIAKDAAGNSSPQSNTVNATTLVPDIEAPTAPTNLAASNVTATTVDLSWNASTDNIGVTDYEVYQDGNLIATVGTTTYQVTGLTNASSYAFYVIARDGVGNSSPQSNTVNIDTPDTESPTAPTNLVASNITATTADLSWDASMDNVGVTNYDVYQDGNLIATIATTTYQATGLTNGTSYAFYIIARDAVNNNSAQSNIIDVDTLDTENPTAPTNLAANNIAVTTVDLSWNTSTDNVGVTDYDVYQDGNLITTVATSSHQVTGLTASTSYSFYVIAKDAAGNSSVQSNTVSITTADPITCTGTVISSFPYIETFDSGIGNWTQDAGDDGNWVLDANGTPSNNTGPSDDITEGGNYFFLEASSNGSVGEIGINATAILVSPCFDLTTLATGTFSFYYHMFGNNVGSINVEATIDDGGIWTNIFSVSGNLGDSWNAQNIDISSYYGEVVKFRFIGLTGNGWSSDIAIDQIAIGEPIIPDYCASNGNDTSDEYIGRVQLNTLDNNNSGVGTTSTGYSDFTGNSALTTDLLGGSTYTITVTPVWPGNSFNEGYAVWIDYNRDGDFLDLGEQVWSQAITQATPVSGTFIIPNTISYGETRMRVSLKYNGVPTACESFDFGEVEDYTINLMYDGLLFKNNVWTPNAPSDTTASEDAFIFDGTYIVTSDIELNDLTVNSGATVEVTQGESITLDGNLTSTGELVLNSVSNAYSSLIVNGTVTGDVVYKRHVNTNASATGNDLISAPLTGQTFANFATANTNIFSNPSVPTEKLFGPFDKAIGWYVTYDTNVPAEAAITLNPAVGYRSASTNNSTFEFRGTVNTAVVNASISKVQGVDYPEWNLIGNPYPSYIKLSDFLATNINVFAPETAAIYGYDGNASNGWKVWNTAYALANPNAVITPGQGFLVSSKLAEGNMIFNPSIRTTATGIASVDDDFIQGRGANNDISYLKLEINNNTVTFGTDFYFTNLASLGFDVGFDANVFNGVAPNYAIYSRLVEGDLGNDISIQSIGFDDINDNLSIPIGINAAQGQQITVSMPTVTLSSDYEVYFEDRQTNTFTLLNSSTYTFDTDSNMNGVGRFYLRFSNSILSVVDSDLDKLQVYVDANIKQIIVKGQLNEATELTLYDIQGREIEKRALDTKDNIHTVNTAQYNSGVYLVTLTNSLSSTTKKLIIR